MSISMYQTSVPVFLRALSNLSVILTKAQHYAESRKIEPTVFINDRLAPDMFPLSRQIQITTDVIKGGIARLAGVEIPSYADTETTFEQLQERIAKTKAFIETISAKQLDGTEDKDISLKVGGNEMSFKGQPYLLQFVIPNAYFHITVAYSILRHNGVDIGKMDFLGNL